jgi:arylformamidase
MTDIIDVSLPLSEDLPHWPGDPPFKHWFTERISDGNDANLSKISAGVHSGTHVDAPLHFVEGGSTVERLSLDVLVGPALVVGLLGVEAITADVLDGLGLPEGVMRLLFRTDNSALWDDMAAGFQEDFVALTADAAQWVVDHGIELVGVDYLSVQRFHDGPETHQILLGASVVVIEGLDLRAVTPGPYELICLPLKIVGSEGAPARTVLRSLSTAENA